MFGSTRVELEGSCTLTGLGAYVTFKVWPHHKYQCRKEGLDVYSAPEIQRWETDNFLGLVLKDIIDEGKSAAGIATFAPPAEAHLSIMCIASADRKHLGTDDIMNHTLMVPKMALSRLVMNQPDITYGQALLIHTDRLWTPDVSKYCL